MPQHRRPSFTRHSSQDMRAASAPGGVEHAVRVDLDGLITQMPGGPEKDKFSKEMDDFYRLFTRYLHEKKHSKPL
ncbi:UTP-glucose-1-phosphate uridylyltransferase, partial [Coemansia sp. RSA 2702]